MTERKTNVKESVKFEEVFEDKHKKHKKKLKRKIFLLSIIIGMLLYSLVFVGKLLDIKYGQKADILAEQSAHIVYILRDAYENSLESSEIIKSIEEYFNEEVLINYIEIKDIPDNKKYSKEELYKLEEIQYRYPSESTKAEKRIETGQIVKIGEKNIFIEFGIDEGASKERHDLYEMAIKSLMMILALAFIIKIIIGAIKEEYKIKMYILLNITVIVILCVFLKIKNLI